MNAGACFVDDDNGDDARAYTQVHKHLVIDDVVHARDSGFEHLMYRCHAARGTMGRPAARNFGTARAQHGTKFRGPGPAQA